MAVTTQLAPRCGPCLWACLLRLCPCQRKWARRQANLCGAHGGAVVNTKLVHRHAASEWRPHGACCRCIVLYQQHQRRHEPIDHNPLPNISTTPFVALCHPLHIAQCNASKTDVTTTRPPSACNYQHFQQRLCQTSCKGTQRPSHLTSTSLVRLTDCRLFCFWVGCRWSFSLTRCVSAAFDRVTARLVLGFHVVLVCHRTSER